LALLLTDSTLSLAALTERDVMDKITGTLSVMRYFYKQKADAEYNLDLCRASKALTEKQLATEMGLLQAEQAKVDLLEFKNLEKADLLDVAKTRTDILQAQGLTEKDLKDLSEDQKAKLTDLLKPGPLKQEDLMKAVQEKLAVLQKPGLSEKDIKAVAEALRVQLVELLKPLPQEEDALIKPIQDEKARLDTYYLRSAAAEDVMFVAREAKLLVVADDRSLQEKHRVIEAEKAQVREILKRKDLTGKALLAVENGVLDFLASMHGAEEKWPEALETKSQVQRVAALQKRVERLQRQLKNLSTFDYEKTYGHVIEDNKAKIAKLSFDLDARVAEYEVIFGKKPHIEVAFEAEMAKYRPRRENIGYVINLN